MNHIGNIKSVYIYAGDRSVEVSATSVSKLHTCFQKAYPHSTIHKVGSRDFHPSRWPINSIVILPGGKCSTWKWLNQASQVAELRTFAYQGGMVLGICAGAFASCKSSEFRISKDKVLKKERGLNFYLGKGMGPLIPDQCPDPSTGIDARAIKVEWKPSQTRGNVVISGGGYFIPPFSEDRQGNFEVLATYAGQPKEKSIAVVKCRVGKGITVLSFPHFEYQANEYPLKNLEEIAKGSLKELSEKKIEELRAIYHEIKEGESFQLHCLQSIAEIFNRHVYNFSGREKPLREIVRESWISC